MHLPDHHDVVDRLAAEHRVLLDRLERAAAAGPGPARTELVGLAAESVRRHIADEECHLHPVLRRVLDDGERRVETDVEVHEQLERLLLELETVGPDGPGVPELLRGLACVTRRHVETVERSRLPLLQLHLDRAELAELAAAVGDTIRDHARTGSTAPAAPPLEPARPAAVPLRG